MDLTQWIRSQAATGQPLNLHAVARVRPDLLELAFAGPAPRGWRRSLIDAGVDPYKIVHEYEENVECGVCGALRAVLGTHLEKCHDMTGDEYREEFGAGREISSESYRAAHFGGRPIAGIAHWERLWSRHYVVDWILRLHDEGHNLNFHHFAKIGRSLANTGWSLFGSWDAALRAAGLDPTLERAIPPFRHWTPAKVVEGLHNFAKLKEVNRNREMSNHLRSAMSRFFGTPQAACQAAGLDYEEINPRAIIKGEPVAGLVTKLVEALRSLESLKGRERRVRLDAICNKDDVNHRIMIGQFGSLRLLAAREGIAPHTVAPEVYRDEADVQHDLDLLEREGMPLTYTTLSKSHGRLYDVIRETGWGAERITKLPPASPATYPECNPRSGLLRDRMIILRRSLRLSMAAAAEKVGIGVDTWAVIESGQGKPKPATIAKIERLLEEHQIPVSTAPDTPAG